MQAVIYRGFGPAREVLKLEDVDSPAPGPGDVAVTLHWSGVNPSDVKSRTASRTGSAELPFPAIVPHSDGAGVISAVGDGVDPARVGQRVWIWNGQWRRAFGTCAETIVLPEAQAVLLPDGIDAQVGATLGIPGLTACHTVFSGGDVTGQTVVVQGAGGTVGYLAVQLATWGGARVIATARGKDADRAAAAGADAVVDFTAPDAAARILAANDGRPVDRIVEVEFGRNAGMDTEIIAENGTICAYGSHQDRTPALPFYPLMFKAVTLEMALVYILTPAQRSDAIDRLTRALAAGALHSPIAATFDLADTAAAHEMVESGVRDGSVLVRLPAAE
jgi:NADPH2:quinone reductase